MGAGAVCTARHPLVNWPAGEVAPAGLAQPCGRMHRSIHDIGATVFGPGGFIAAGGFWLFFAQRDGFDL